MIMRIKHLFLSQSVILFSLLATPSETLVAQTLPQPTREARPGIRWWWLGSAVDKENLKWNLSQYKEKGIGAVEITPIYGVQGNDKNNIQYLSPPMDGHAESC